MKKNLTNTTAALVMAGLLLGANGAVNAEEIITYSTTNAETKEVGEEVAKETKKEVETIKSTVYEKPINKEQESTIKEINEIKKNLKSVETKGEGLSDSIREAYIEDQKYKEENNLKPTVPSGDKTSVVDTEEDINEEISGDAGFIKNTENTATKTLTDGTKEEKIKDYLGKVEIAEEGIDRLKSYKDMIDGKNISEEAKNKLKDMSDKSIEEIKKELGNITEIIMEDSLEKEIEFVNNSEKEIEDAWENFAKEEQAKEDKKKEEEINKEISGDAEFIKNTENIATKTLTDGTKEEKIKDYLGKVEIAEEGIDRLKSYKDMIDGKNISEEAKNKLKDMSDKSIEEIKKELGNITEIIMEDSLEKEIEFVNNSEKEIEDAWENFAKEEEIRREIANDIKFIKDTKDLGIKSLTNGTKEEKVRHYISKINRAEEAIERIEQNIKGVDNKNTTDENKELLKKYTKESIEEIKKEIRNLTEIVMEDSLEKEIEFVNNSEKEIEDAWENFAKEEQAKEDNNTDIEDDYNNVGDNNTDTEDDYNNVGDNDTDTEDDYNNVGNNDTDTEDDYNNAGNSDNDKENDKMVEKEIIVSSSSNGKILGNSSDALYILVLDKTTRKVVLEDELLVYGDKNLVLLNLEDEIDIINLTEEDLRRFNIAIESENNIEGIKKVLKEEFKLIVKEK